MGVRVGPGRTPGVASAVYIFHITHERQAQLLSIPNNETLFSVLSSFLRPRSPQGARRAMQPHVCSILLWVVLDVQRSYERDYTASGHRPSTKARRGSFESELS